MHKRCALFAILIGAGFYSPSIAFNGKAITAVHRWSPVSTTSRLLLSTISNSTITSQDTILKADPNVVFSYPTISFDGSKIAFFKGGAGVCIIDIVTRSVSVVAPGYCSGLNQERHLAWPGTDSGKWLYYHRQCAGCRDGGTGEIWRVNVTDTTKREFICDFKTDDNNAVMSRWSLSADARHSVVGAGGAPGVTPFPGGGYPFLFPPTLIDPNTKLADPRLTAPSICCNYSSECNQGITAGGKILFNFSGSHMNVRGKLWDWQQSLTMDYHSPYLFSIVDAENWMGIAVESAGESLHYMRGSSNSDRVITVIFLYTNNMSPADQQNLCVADWKEKKAILATSNPKDAYNTIPRLCVDPGDFWASGGPAGCYQDTLNNWISVETGTQVTTGGSRIIAGRVTADQSMASVYNLKGVRVDAHFIQRKERAFARGLYAVRGKNSAMVLSVFTNR